jgi:hypothetical protein
MSLTHETGAHASSVLLAASCREDSLSGSVTLRAKKGFGKDAEASTQDAPISFGLFTC